MTFGDTIAAVASGEGPAWRALLRVSGPRACRVAAWMLEDDRVIEAGRAGGGAFVCRVRVDGGPEPAGSKTRSVAGLGMWFAGPRSFTGEDVLELMVPAQAHLVRRVMARVVSLEGVRPAGPGEFSARAYQRGKMSLEQAEGVAAAISAEQRGELEAARRLMDGRTGERYRAWRDELVTLLALVEAGIDFSDQEDVVAIEAGALRARVGRVEAEIRGVLGRDDRDDGRGGRARVVIAGEPNAGKSTLMNALLGRERAIVSEVAGTTRDVIEEVVDLSRWGVAGHVGGGEVVLCDTAGLEDQATTAGEIEASMARASAKAIASADLVVHCDPLGRFEGAEIAQGDLRRGLRVRTKGDLPIAEAGCEDVAVCALDGWNLRLLAQAIARRMWGERGNREAVAARHRAALGSAAATLRRLGASDGTSAEIAAEELRAAVEALGALTGRVETDEVLARVFSLFCVGK